MGLVPRQGSRVTYWGLLAADGLLGLGILAGMPTHWRWATSPAFGSVGLFILVSGIIALAGLVVLATAFARGRLWAQKMHVVTAVLYLTGQLVWMPLKLQSQPSIVLSMGAGVVVAWLAYSPPATMLVRSTATA